MSRENSREAPSVRTRHVFSLVIWGRREKRARTRCNRARQQLSVGILVSILDLRYSLSPPDSQNVILFVRYRQFTVCRQARVHTHKFAYTPTLTCFSESSLKNLSGFHWSASSPQTCGNLCDTQSQPMIIAYDTSRSLTGCSRKWR